MSLNRHIIKCVWGHLGISGRHREGSRPCPGLCGLRKSRAASPASSGPLGRCFCLLVVLLLLYVLASWEGSSARPVGSLRPAAALWVSPSREPQSSPMVRQTDGQGGLGGSACPPRDSRAVGPGFLGAGAQQVHLRLDSNKPAVRPSGPPGTRGAGVSPPRADPPAGDAGRAPEGLASCPPGS